jgi:predicted double-glycine peptidase
VSEQPAFSMRFSGTDQMRAIISYGGMKRVAREHGNKSGRITHEDNDDATSPPAIVVVILRPSPLSLPHIIFVARRQQ